MAPIRHFGWLFLVALTIGQQVSSSPPAAAAGRIFRFRRSFGNEAGRTEMELIKSVVNALANTDNVFTSQVADKFSPIYQRYTEQLRNVINGPDDVIEKALKNRLKGIDANKVRLDGGENVRRADQYGFEGGLEDFAKMWIRIGKDIGDMAEIIRDQDDAQLTKTFLERIAIPLKEKWTDVLKARFVDIVKTSGDLRYNADSKAGMEHRKLLTFHRSTLGRAIERVSMNLGLVETEQAGMKLGPFATNEENILLGHSHVPKQLGFLRALEELRSDAVEERAKLAKRTDLTQREQEDLDRLNAIGSTLEKLKLDTDKIALLPNQEEIDLTKVTDIDISNELKASKSSHIAAKNSIINKKINSLFRGLAGWSISRGISNQGKLDTSNKYLTKLVDVVKTSIEHCYSRSNQNNLNGRVEHQEKLDETVEGLNEVLDGIKAHNEDAWKMLDERFKVEGGLSLDNQSQKSRLKVAARTYFAKIKLAAPDLAPEVNRVESLLAKQIEHGADDDDADELDKALTGIGSKITRLAKITTFKPSSGSGSLNEFRGVLQTAFQESGGSLKSIQSAISNVDGHLVKMAKTISKLGTNPKAEAIVRNQQNALVEKEAKQMLKVGEFERAFDSDLDELVVLAHSFATQTGENGDGDGVGLSGTLEKIIDRSVEWSKVGDKGNKVFKTAAARTLGIGKKTRSALAKLNRNKQKPSARPNKPKIG